MKTAPLALLVACILFGTTACGGGDEAKPADGDTPSASASGDGGGEAAEENADTSWDEKVQAYIELGNRLRGFNDGASDETRARWRAEAEAKVAAGDFQEIRSDSHYVDDSAMENLKKALAMPGKTPELDKAAKALVTVADQYVPAWKELQEYNKAKRYEDDAGAKGKELLVTYQEGFPKIQSAVNALAVQIDGAAKIAHEKALAKYKAEGKLLEMHTWQALGASEKVIDLFNDAEDFKDEAKIKQANAHIAEMETNLTAMRAEHEKRKALGDEKDGLPMIDRYDSVADELTEMAGDYREARKDASKFNDAVKNYNEAVDALNMMN